MLQEITCKSCDRRVPKKTNSVQWIHACSNSPEFQGSTGRQLVLGYDTKNSWQSVCYRQIV